MGGCCEAYGTCARITVMMMTAAGLAFSILAAQSCEFLEFGSTIGGQQGKAGLFSFTDPTTGECVEYPSDTPIEATDNTSRVCGALAAIFGLIALVLIMFEFCICKLCCARLLEGCVYAVAWICQGLTFLLYNNSTFCTAANRTCNWGQGSVWSVTAFSLYFVSSGIMCCTPRSDPILCKKREQAKVKKEAEKMAAEKEEQDKAAEEAEAGKSAASHEQEEGPADSSPAASPAASGAGDEAAAHASAY